MNISVIFSVMQIEVPCIPFCEKRFVILRNASILDKQMFLDTTFEVVLGAWVGI
jgi:hypothetical protein